MQLATQTISRPDLQCVYENICIKWQEIIKEKMNFHPFANEYTFDNETIKRGFEQADERQKVMLSKYFINAPADKNPFKTNLNKTIVNDNLSEMFGESKVMELLNIPESKSHNRSLYVFSDHTVTTTITKIGGTIITIEKK